MAETTSTPETEPPDGSAVQTLYDRMRGPVLDSSDEGYDDARSLWNGMFEKHPSIVARCTGAADVMAAVDFAREHDLLLAVKGGGHSLAGKSVCDDGLLIDLSPMDGVRVDPDSQTARVGPGTTWGDFDHEAQAFGLATTGGVDSRTGVAGLTLGGGIGYLARSYGLATDNLLSVDLVTAEGELVHASEDVHPELFWGIRGGSGNFGIVTSFEFELHEVGPEILTAQVFHPIDDVRRVLEFYQEFMADAPDEVTCYATITRVPTESAFPEVYHNEPAVALVGAYSGAIEDGRPLLAPLAQFGDPILAAVEPMAYTALQQSDDDGFPDGERYYQKAHFLETITDAVIDVIVEHTETLPGQYSGALFEPMGGVINEVDATATAYPHRNAAFSFGITGGWSDPDRDEEIMGWVREFFDDLASHATGGVYTNYLAHDEDDRVDGAYRENHERLVELKNEWDPENLFRLNSNVEPASGGGR
jgi:FAD/FMN-containing dehydrogenase